MPGFSFGAEMAQPSHDKSAERLLLEQILERLEKMEETQQNQFRLLSRRRAAELVLQTRLARLESDHSGLAKVVGGHTKKINTAMGFIAAFGVIGTAITWLLATSKGIWERLGGRHS